MSSTAQSRGTEEALDRIEGTILPGLALTLEALLDATRLARPGQGDAARAAELRAIAVQLNMVVRQLEAATSRAQTVPEWPFRMSA
ncbi:MAG TPA: hypothetical protein VF631_06225 [Allosphingosinicella sp.]|jgi:hypothetical protein|uniref:hypothetical protein n=1 Tax=Allosphingosinicella sp. TaxID=2823234 RepID=UPI002F2A67BC